MKIQPGLKAKLLFIFIVCSDKIQNRVMLSGKGNENGEKTITGLTLKPKKNNFARAAHFFVHFFDDFNVKLPETRLVTLSLRKCRTSSCSPFFHYRSFSFFYCGLQHFSFSHSHCKIFMLFFQQSLTPLFLSLVLALCRSFSR